MKSKKIISKLRQNIVLMRAYDRIEKEIPRFSVGRQKAIEIIKDEVSKNIQYLNCEINRHNNEKKNNEKK